MTIPFNKTVILQSMLHQRQKDAEKSGPCIVPGPFHQEKGCLRVVFKRQWCQHYNRGEPRWQFNFLNASYIYYGHGSINTAD